MTSRTSQGLARDLRLRHATEFARVYNGRYYAADEVLVVKAARNQLPITRLGLAVSRAVGNAVVRNRWKRRIREAFRLSRQQLPAGLDLIVKPRRGAQLNLTDIARSLVRLAGQLARRLPGG